MLNIIETKNILQQNKNNLKTTDRQIELKTEEEKKSQLMYELILKHLHEEKPFIKDTFSIAELASQLNTNINYIYNAIKLSPYKNFNDLVNSYRVKIVKKQIDNGQHEQFTLSYLYHSAGFKSQSTFNRAFKANFLLNPSEYILKLKTQKQSPEHS
ncbi:MAG: AraC family transcriptional regulator [Paludibacter sp.]|nr:AraC family transcriptional regulator [Paludibacter sp.]